MIFKRLETDAEFRERIRQTANPTPDHFDRMRGYIATALDDFAWTRFKMQRRIVDDET